MNSNTVHFINILKKDLRESQIVSTGYKKLTIYGSLEQLDKKRLKNFRQTHPSRYQPPPSDTASNASRRFNSINATGARASHLSA